MNTEKAYLNLNYDVLFSKSVFACCVVLYFSLCLKKKKQTKRTFCQSSQRSVGCDDEQKGAVCSCFILTLGFTNKKNAF